LQHNSRSNKEEAGLHLVSRPPSFSAHEKNFYLTFTPTMF